MDKIAFVCSGQGDQHPGMGQDLVQSCPAAAAVFSVCEKIRPGTTNQCFWGTEEELKLTKNTQPCLYALELAAAAALEQSGIRPHAVAGFSLGEVSAAALSGIVSMETGFHLVCRRGELMQQAAEQVQTAMVAVVKLSASIVQTLSDSYDHVYPVNFNCPDQVTVSGDVRQIQQFSADVRAAGGRTVPLKVQGAFHSPYMLQAAEAFARDLKTFPFQPMHTVLYSNITARPYEGDSRLLLSKQICNPVLWDTLIRNMIADGITRFIELGPGSTLTNLIRKIAPNTAAHPYTQYLKEGIFPC